MVNLLEIVLMMEVVLLVILEGMLRHLIAVIQSDPTRGTSFLVGVAHPDSS